MRKSRIQWHSACCGAIELEFRQDRDKLLFEKEHPINIAPIKIDILIIKKVQSAEIENPIGKIFRGHNLIEFKSPNDELNKDVYLKCVGYACLYKSHEKYMDEIKENDITITFIRSRYPKKLFAYFRVCGFEVTQEYEGIYYIKTNQLFPIQVIVTKQLENDVWLAGITDNLEEKKARELISEARKLDQKGDHDNADAILQVAMRANESVFDRVKEEQSMCEALMELMRPEFEEKLRVETEKVVERVTEDVTKQVTEDVTKQVTKQVKETEIEKKIRDITELCQEMGLSKAEAIEKVRSRCDLAKRTAAAKVRLYWKYEGV